ncbi:MAG: luciferase family oxidoreductase group 1 [Candidatus Azotimanducaceae bacterium]|jgi:luciferase family oxidoreductase group 1
MTRFSVLDLAPIVQGSNAGEALGHSLDLAQHAEAWGYNRYWVAEHHNMRGIASSATAVVIGHLAGGTSTIRVGAGGIMLPNHAPLMIAEQFGTLASLYSGRIDLGLGRAPGTDQITMQALRRTLSGDVEDFPRDVMELQHYLGKPVEGQRVIATPGADTNVPLWILGSSLFGAQLAAMLGLPFAFASHFAPAYMDAAIEIYRDTFKPSEQLSQPHLMLGFNICAADTDEEANFLRSSSLQSFVNLRRGTPGQLPPPIEGFEESLSAGEQQMVHDISRCSAVGSPKSIETKLSSFLTETGADELMIVSSVFDHPKRLRSYEIAAEAFKNVSDSVSDSVSKNANLAAPASA